jgi:hypothetical protein
MPLNTSHTLAFSLRWPRSVMKLIVSWMIVSRGAISRSVISRGVISRAIVGAACLSLGLVACDSSQPQAIADLVSLTTKTNQTQTQTTGQTVIISGSIVRRVPLVNGAAYLLEDDTGAIWVRTDRAPEDSEGEVIVSGTLEGIGAGEPSTDGLHDRYIQEQTRKPPEVSP